jgi:tRNA nucleotidyltransferase (CCA-adding enzyme)
MPLRTRSFDLPLPQDLAVILARCPALARAYVVGGGVRDALLGLPVKDLDVEVFGESIESLASALAPFGRVDVVGRSFGVVKLTVRAGVTHDFSLPRRDSKVGSGHRGFVSEVDPELSIEAAAARRDFTINALMYDPRRHEILDAHGGLEDLGAGILRHTSEAFPEDPLRVLRGMQFVSRFHLRPAAETVALCRSIAGTFPELARERVRDEWWKWATRSQRPSAGLYFLRDTEWVRHFPEIDALSGTPQDPEWHPEGDVFTHTAHCCDALVGLPTWREADEMSRGVWMLATLAHDFGKPSTTREEGREGRCRIVSPGHEQAGGPIAAAFLARIGAPNEVLARVVPLVINHLAHLQAGTDRAVRRLALRLVPETLEALCVVMSADALGRPPRPAVVPHTITQLLERATALRLKREPPKPLLLGRHLLKRGMRPGKDVGRITRAAFEAQLDGEFSNLAGAFAWTAAQADLPLPPETRLQLDSSRDAANELSGSGGGTQDGSR